MRDVHHFDADAYEYAVREAGFLASRAAAFARLARRLRRQGRELGAELQRQRARCYGQRARKAFNAARRFLPH